MKTVDIYLENAGKSPRKCKGWYGYVLEYKGKQLHTRSYFVETEGTRQERSLEMLLDAVGRCRDCRIRIHTDEKYLAGMFKMIPKYVKTKWITARGETVKHKDLWMKVVQESWKKPMQIILGPHGYTDWLRTEIARRKNKNE